jgi:hypothetical protein
MPVDSEIFVEVETVGGDEDLAIEIARSLPKVGREQVTCKRVSKHHYRCNWWRLEDIAAYDNPGMKGSLVTTGRICQSEFVHAMKVGGKLKIQIISR